MNKKIAKLLIKWVLEVTTTIIYQSNIFPQDHCMMITESANELIAELEKVE